jgi:hypothetical protein
MSRQKHYATSPINTAPVLLPHGRCDEKIINSNQDCKHRGNFATDCGSILTTGGIFILQLKMQYNYVWPIFLIFPNLVPHYGEERGVISPLKTKRFKRALNLFSKRTPKTPSVRGSSYGRIEG